MSKRQSHQHQVSNKRLEDQTKNIPKSLQGCLQTNLVPGDIDVGRGFKKRKCLICKQEWPNSFIEKLKCQHAFCFECLNNYVTYKLMVGMELKCPCCDKNINYGQWYQRLPQPLKAMEKTMVGFKDKQTHKKCDMQGDCDGTVDLKAAKFACNKCQKEYCYQCLFQKHEGSCRQNFFANSYEMKVCPQCFLYRQPVNHCTHFSCELEQKKCMVCFMGWSDKYFHDCKKESEVLPHSIWFRDSIMRSSWFLNIIRGVIMAMLFPVVLVLALVAVIVVQALAIVIIAIVAPLHVFKQACQDGIQTQTYLTLFCLPCAQVFFIVTISKQLWEEHLLQIPDYLVTYLLTNKSFFYYTQPYRQNPQNYTPFQTTNIERYIYLFIMIVLLPVLILLPFLQFVLSSVFVFFFTLLSLPVIASKQKNIPIWVSVLFFPIVFFHFIAVDYFGKFVFNQLKDIYNFYKYYFMTLGSYLCCRDPKHHQTLVEDNSCAENVEPLPVSSQR